ncbi:MAG: hypothetical protein IPJ38_16930 [Dechloromonas sp.]|uniref:DUF6851 domain-containing protein n=1 Tax=Candidatus Dechloromonas phosphorivorans TaxID=2899244 RepID=A0A935KD66_9RHOO|nr:hypothetical protein [Candidatus Dechloromonas phosphorivorans]
MNLILEWNHIMLEAIRNVGKLSPTSPDLSRGGPPQVARSISIIYSAVYDAWSAYDAVAKPVHRTTPRKPVAQHTEANRRKAISQASYRALIDQFPPDIYGSEFRASYESMLSQQLAKDGISIGGPTPVPLTWATRLPTMCWLFATATTPTKPACTLTPAVMPRRTSPWPCCCLRLMMLSISLVAGSN